MEGLWVELEELVVVPLRVPGTVSIMVSAVNSSWSSLRRCMLTCGVVVSVMPFGRCRVN